MNEEKIRKLDIEYNNLQLKYGDKDLDSIYNGGSVNNANIFFIFMNPTGRNIASSKKWLGRKSPWIGTKNIWKLFYKTNLLSESTYKEILSKKAKDWDYDFSDKLYDEVSNNKYFISNLGKCTLSDARRVDDKVLLKYLELLKKEISIINPKIIISFGNQVSSILLNKKISVSKCRKEYYEIIINKKKYKVFPIFYPVGNGIFNIDKSIEDINYIISKYINK